MPFPVPAGPLYHPGQLQVLALELPVGGGRVGLELAEQVGRGHGHRPHRRSASMSAFACTIAFWGVLHQPAHAHMNSPQHPATLSTTATAPPMTHLSHGAGPGRSPPLRTLRTGWRGSGRLSMNGPIGPYPQLGHRLDMTNFGGGVASCPVKLTTDKADGQDRRAAGSGAA